MAYLYTLPDTTIIVICTERMHKDIDHELYECEVHSK